MSACSKENAPTPLHSLARVGLVHHLLYPECVTDPELHARTLAEFIRRPDIETFDYCLPFERELRDRLIPLVRGCGKIRNAYALHFHPLRKMSLCDPAPAARAQNRLLVAEQIAAAAASGASGFVFASGGPTPAQATPEHHRTFEDFCVWFCRALEPHGLTALLEPFDMTIDKCFLYGPVQTCVELLDRVRARGCQNIGLELDMAHLPLMGETFAGAIRAAQPYLKRVHLGNCVLADRQHPRYGDTHPPMGLPGGEIGDAELAEILGLLREVGFLNARERGDLLLEMTPWPGRTAEETVTDAFARLDRAWNQVTAAVC